MARINRIAQLLVGGSTALLGALALQACETIPEPPPCLPPNFLDANGVCVAPMIPPTYEYLVINNGSAALSCAVRQPGGQWSSTFNLSPGSNWRRATPDPYMTIDFQCHAPLRGGPYTLWAGHRYNVLPAGGGRYELREVTP